MSFLNSTKSVTTRTPLPLSTTLRAALALLQDLDAFPNLQPLVTENKVIEPPPAASDWLVVATEAAVAAAAAAAAAGGEAAKATGEELHGERDGGPQGVAAETPEYRSVTVAVPFGPFGKSNVTTRSGYVKMGDGLLNVFQAPLGLYGQNRWRIVSEDSGDAGEVVGDGGGEGVEGQRRLVLLEEARLTGPALLMPFIMMTEKKAHAEAGVNFAKELETNGEVAGV